MAVARKQFKIPVTARTKLTQFAALGGVGRTDVLKEWIESFLKNGTDYEPPPMVKVETILDEDTLWLAEKKAEEMGFSLRDVIMFEISEIDKL